MANEKKQADGRKGIRDWGSVECWGTAMAIGGVRARLDAVERVISAYCEMQEGAAMLDETRNLGGAAPELNSACYALSCEIDVLESLEKGIKEYLGK
jgi:hypothetical protein